MAGPSNRMLEAIMGTAEIYGRQMSKTAAIMYLSDLSTIPEEDVLKALQECRREQRSFPTVSDVLSRAKATDGRPGAEEAWAMIPRDDASSIVWTSEMAQAYGTCRNMMDDDMVGARMAFKEVYLRLVQNARDSKRPVKWLASLGHDKTSHDSVLKEAVALGRITRDHAQSLLPADMPTEIIANIVKHTQLLS